MSGFDVSCKGSILAKHALTYQKWFEIARAMEAADSNTAVLKTREPLVQKFKNGVSQAKERKDCFRCRKTGYFHKDACCQVVVKRDTSPQFASEYPRRRSLQRRYTSRT